MILMAELKIVGPNSISDDKSRENIVSGNTVDQLANSFTSAEKQFSDAGAYIANNTVTSDEVDKALQVKMTYSRLNS